MVLDMAGSETMEWKLRGTMDRKFRGRMHKEKETYEDVGEHRLMKEVFERCGTRRDDGEAAFQR